MRREDLMVPRPCGVIRISSRQIVGPEGPAGWGRGRGQEQVLGDGGLSVIGGTQPQEEDTGFLIARKGCGLGGDRLPHGGASGLR